MVTPLVPIVEVPEDNITVTVCYNTSIGITEPLTINVTTAQKTTGNIATGEDLLLVCSFSQQDACSPRIVENLQIFANLRTISLKEIFMTFNFMIRVTHPMTTPTTDMLIHS